MPNSDHLTCETNDEPQPSSPSLSVVVDNSEDNADDDRASLIDGLKELGVKVSSKRLKNFSKNIKSPEDSITIEVNDEAQAIAATKLILAHDTKLRAAAGRIEKEPTHCCVARFFKEHFIPGGNRHKYDKSFSFNAGAFGDVTMLFSDKFRRIGAVTKQAGDDPDAYEVEVAAGVTVEQLEPALAKAGFSLETISMIVYVSLGGLVANGCHGTGKDLPGIAGLVSEVRYINYQGEVCVLNKDSEHFDTIMQGHMGLPGIVLSMKLGVVPQFKLKEQVRNFDNVAALREQLPELIEHQYFTTMLIPDYKLRLAGGTDEGESSFDADVVSIPKIQVRVWDKTEDPITEYDEQVGEYTPESLASELGTKAGELAQEVIFRSGLYELIPAYMELTAALVTLTRGESDKVDWANNLVHPVRHFPPKLRDFSCIIDMDEGEDRAAFLANVMAFAEQCFIDSELDEISVTYAMYVRYYDNKMVIEFVSHPLAPKFDAMAKELVDYLDGVGKSYRFHLGKEFPQDVTLLENWGSEALSAFKQALIDEAYNGDEDAFLASPFLSPYYKFMLAYELSEEEAQSLASQKAQLLQQRAATSVYGPMSEKQCQKELKRLIEAVHKLHHKGECEALKQAINRFENLCKHDLEQMKSHHSVSL